MTEILSQLDRRFDGGPFDIIGDVHGCIRELLLLLDALGYEISDNVARHAQGRRLIFLGDLVDRGPDCPAVLELVMESVEKETALCVPGNHDVKLVKKLKGRDVRISHGLAETLAQLDLLDDLFKRRITAFVDSLPLHLILDQGKLVVAHAGIKEKDQGRLTDRIAAFCLYGDVSGEMDEYGLPIRLNWASDYSGDALVVYGHTPIRQSAFQNNTICIDNGCVFGGQLTALRYPERELVSVPAARVYYESERPL